MQKAGRRLRPELENCEARTLLSAGLGSPSTVADVARTSRGFVELQGRFHGQYVVASPNPDVGVTFDTSGSGHLRGVGHAGLKGAMRSIGFIAQGMAQGDVTLVRPGGTITIHLTGPVQMGGPTRLPSVFSAGVTGATGKYRGLHGTGSATLKLVPGDRSSGGAGGSAGTFTLVFSPRPMPL
jgi:hypothetical protein